MRVLIALLCCVAFAPLAYSVEGNRMVEIQEILSITADRPGQPGSQNIIRVYVDEGQWQNANCREDAADLLVAESATLSILLTAWMSGKNVKIAVDDRRKPYDNVCQIVWLRVL